MEEAIEAIKSMGITQDEGQIREVSAFSTQYYTGFYPRGGAGAMATTKESSTFFAYLLK